ncbi:MAG: hypothetical protein WC100_03425 [Sterolibacterium sp.]
MAGRMVPELRTRLLAEGRFEAYCARRKVLQDAGNSAAQIKTFMDVEFAPLIAGTPAAIGIVAQEAQAAKLLEGIPDGDADEREIIRWVFDFMDAPDEVLKETAPSRGALSYLLRIRKSLTLQEDFYKVIWPKLLPTKAQMEQGEKFSDDGRVLGLIDSVAAAYRSTPVLQPGAQRPDGQPGVPPGTVAAVPG